MNYEVVQLSEKKVVGVSALTRNDETCPATVGALWDKYMGGVQETIKNRATANCIGLYSDYGDNTYDTTIGAIVSKNENPELTEKTIPAGKYAKFHIKGDVVKDVGAAWTEIWNMTLDRSFAADFEEYLGGDDKEAEIDIYVALK